MSAREQAIEAAREAWRDACQGGRAGPWYSGAWNATYSAIVAVLAAEVRQLHQPMTIDLYGGMDVCRHDGGPWPCPDELMLRGWLESGDRCSKCASSLAAATGVCTECGHDELGYYDDGCPCSACAGPGDRS